MPRSSFHLPSSKCSNLVTAYISIKSYAKESVIMDKHIPDGYTAVVIHFTESKKYIINDGEKYELPSCFFTTPNKKNVLFEGFYDLNALVVICKTSLFSKTFRIRMDQLYDKPFFSFNSVIDENIYEEMKAEPKLKKRIKLLENYLIGNYKVDKYIPDEIDMIYEKIILANPNQKISELLVSLQMNQRSFRRQFINRVGLSPKRLFRIIRVNYVWDMYRQNPTMSFNDLVYACSFFDQSHFINDFKEIVGETPKEFFSRDLKKVETFSGKGRPLPST